MSDDFDHADRFILGFLIVGGIVIVGTLFGVLIGFLWFWYQYLIQVTTFVFIPVVLYAVGWVAERLGLPKFPDGGDER